MLYRPSTLPKNLGPIGESNYARLLEPTKSSLFPDSVPWAQPYKDSASKSQKFQEFTLENLEVYIFLPYFLTS